MAPAAAPARPAAAIPLPQNPNPLFNLVPGTGLLNANSSANQNIDAQFARLGTNISQINTIVNYLNFINNRTWTIIYTILTIIPLLQRQGVNVDNIIQLLTQANNAMNTIRQQSAQGSYNQSIGAFTVANQALSAALNAMPPAPPPGPVQQEIDAATAARREVMAAVTGLPDGTPPARPLPGDIFRGGRRRRRLRGGAPGADEDAVAKWERQRQEAAKAVEFLLRNQHTLATAAHAAEQRATGERVKGSEATSGVAAQQGAQPTFGETLKHIASSQPMRFHRTYFL